MDYLPYIWAVLGFILIGAQLFIPGFVIFFFGVGALVTALFSSFLPGRLAIQVLIWLAASSLSLVLLKGWVTRVFRGRLLDLEREERSPEAVVVERILPGVPGQVRYLGTTMRAESLEGTYEPGDRVTILQKDNLTCQVTRSLDANQEDV
jgi:membrane protein implicated in regulation of membrane protease activity